MELDLRQKAFFLMVLKQRSKEAMALIELVPSPAREKMRAMYESVAKHEDSAIQLVAGEELRKIAKPQSRSFLSEVHDDWIVDLLLNESPHLISTILRYLPAERVNAILDNLPKEILEKLPKLSDTFATPVDLVEWLKQKFENQFELTRNYMPGQEFEFNHFSLLRAAQIMSSFCEMGYREVALGLTSIPEKARLIVMGRLTALDRQRVDHYLKTSTHVSEQRIKRAQAHVVSKEIDTTDSGLFIRELGYVIFAKSLLPRDIKDIEIIKKKMSKTESVIFGEMVEQHLNQNTEASVVAYREDVLTAVKQILREKK